MLNPLNLLNKCAFSGRAAKRAFGCCEGLCVWVSHDVGVIRASQASWARNRVISVLLWQLHSLRVHETETPTSEMSQDVISL